MSIVIITDYRFDSGLGNYLRSKYLYKFLKKDKSFDIDFQILSKKKKNKKKYSIIVLDLPNYNYKISDIIKNFSKKKSKVIGLDYNLKHKIDCNISIFKKNLFAKQNYVGLEYTIIRDEFVKKKFNQNKNLFFISIGSSDIKKIKNKIKDLFLPYFTEVYLNSDFKNDKNNNDYQKKYLKKMHSCKMAASNGGTTLLELLFLNKIVFVYPQNRLELNFAKFLKKKGYTIFINDFKITKKKIINSKNKIQEHNQIDEFGTKRISELISFYKDYT